MVDFPVGWAVNKREAKEERRHHRSALDRGSPVARMRGWPKADKWWTRASTLRPALRAAGYADLRSARLQQAFVGLACAGPDYAPSLGELLAKPSSLEELRRVKSTALRNATELTQATSLKDPQNHTEIAEEPFFGKTPHRTLPK